MSPSLKDIKKRADAVAIRSANSLKREYSKQITRVFVTALECLEIKFGREFDGYDEIRSKILRTGNDAKRYLEELIDAKYNIEKVPDMTIVSARTERRD